MADNRRVRKIKPKSEGVRCRYTDAQIAQAIEVIKLCDRDINLAACKTGIKATTLRSWWCKFYPVVSEQEGKTIKAREIIERKTSLAAAEMQIDYLRHYNDERNKNMTALSDTIGQSIARISELIPDCTSMHLLSEATKSMADAYKIIGSTPSTSDEAEKQGKTINNNFTQIIAQFNKSRQGGQGGG